MNKKNKQIKAIDFQEYLAERLKSPTFKRYYDEYGKQLEIAYSILLLRKEKKLSQAQLAKKIGTKQSNIARMESGQQNLTIDMLQKLAHVFNKKLEVKIS
jgi:ribosome-binding protein aMBF1 (putative translation factor)